MKTAKTPDQLKADKARITDLVGMALDTPTSRVSLENAAVGDEAVIHSRGQLRRGRVIKVGRKNVTVEYVTVGGIEAAQKVRPIWAQYDDEQCPTDTLKQWRALAWSGEWFHLVQVTTKSVPKSNDLVRTESNEHFPVYALPVHTNAK